MVHGMVHTETAWCQPRLDHGGGDDMASQRQLRQQEEQGATLPVWTVESVRGLGLTTTIDKAASILGISRTKAYALAKQDDFPIKLVRAGRRYLVPTPALIDLLTGGRTAE
jgi:hypothetical protein